MDLSGALFACIATVVLTVLMLVLLVVGRRRLALKRTIWFVVAWALALPLLLYALSATWFAVMSDYNVSGIAVAAGWVLVAAIWTIGAIPMLQGSSRQRGHGQPRYRQIGAPD